MPKGQGSGTARRAGLAFACAALLIAAGCGITLVAARDRPVLLEGPAEEWARVLLLRPLPRGYRRAVPGEKIALRLRLLSLKSWEGGLTPPAGGLLLGSRPWAPAARLWEQPLSLPEPSSVDKALLRPVPEMRLPEVGIPAPGPAGLPLFPGDAGYPWEEDEWLCLEWAGTPPARLAAWMRSAQGALAETGEGRVVKLYAVGDVMLDRGTDGILLRGGSGVEAVFRDTLPLLRSADILAGNLEGPLTRRGKAASKTYTFRFRPESTAALESAGFSFLGVANNHAFDYGEEGFLDDLAALSASPLGWAGGGRNLEEALRPCILERRGAAFSLWALAGFPRERTGFDGSEHAAGPERPGMLWADGESLRGLSGAFSPKRFDAVLVHAGTEFSERPDAAQRELCRGLIDAGADLVLCSHPHVLQGLECYKGRLIAWSLGNFVFGDFGASGSQTAVLCLAVSGGKVRMAWPVAARLEGNSVRLERSDEINKKIMRLSAELAR